MIAMMIVKDSTGKIVPHPLDEKQKKFSVEHGVALALAKKALSGNVEAIKEYHDTRFGKLTEKQEIEGKGGGAVIVRIVDNIPRKPK